MSYPLLCYPKTDQQPNLFLPADLQSRTRSDLRFKWSKPGSNGVYSGTAEEGARGPGAKAQYARGSDFALARGQKVGAAEARGHFRNPRGFWDSGRLVWALIGFGLVRLSGLLGLESGLGLG
ncbi:hypothetical protein ES332_D03G080700v1 [Gossypium tomentosum]|uniref:Uncharacterized protein n=1 Tax=Gossypium tomentosum TaxID=34277 RepID=A0A5D2LM77_GOSTO|nr:hypothetical protein ES332_D03G080700v1 [Gossypium tomentosum]